MISFVGGYPWCMFAGPRRWEPETCDAMLAAISDLDPLLDHAVNEILVARFGTWVHGRDSVLQSRQASWDRRARIARALAAWNDALTQLDDAFAKIDEATRGQSIERIIEYAVLARLPIVVALTYCEETWFPDFTQAMCWYCEHAGIPDAESIIDRIVTGRFRSWIAPDELTARATATDLGREIAALDPAVDALEHWLATRDWPRSEPVPKPRDVPADADPHLSYIREIDAMRDRERGEALSVALDACRESAMRGEPLDFARLAAWQHAVLGGSATPEFRRTDAFAKEGRERYASFAGIEDLFGVALLEAEDPTTPIIIRAARVYLDVCYFHPFSDGNGRAARLALDHVLAREGYGLRSIEPLVRVAWSVHASPLVHCARLLHVLVGPTS